MSVIAKPIFSGTRAHQPEKKYSAVAQKILQVAICDFDEGGFLNSSISAIAEHAGISKSLVTYYFPTKAALAAAIMNLAHPGGVFMGVKRDQADPLAAIVHAVVHVASSVAHLGLARVALKLRNTPELSNESSSVPYHGWLTRITDYLDEAQRSGLVFENVDVETESRRLVACLVGLTTLAIRTGDFMFLVDDAEALTRQRIDTLTSSGRRDGETFHRRAVHHDF